MKGKKLTEWFTSKKIVSSCAAIALAAVIGGVSLFSGTGETPEFPSYTDPVMETSIQEEETPLASQPKTSVKTTRSTKTTKKTVKLKKASKKSYTKKLKTTTKVSNSSKTSGNTTVATKKTVVTNATEKYTKKSKKKLVTSKVITTVQTTTTQQVTVTNVAAANTTSSGTTAKSPATTTTVKATTASTATANKTKYEANVTSVAGKMDSRVLSAFQKLGFKLVVDPSVNYSGYFEARSRSITMKQIDDSVYHELGHFLAFIAGNADRTSSFQSIYAAEKSKVTAFNKAYVTQNASEYFAESVKDYILNNAALKSTRPQTYAAVQNALNQITDAQIAKIQKIYGPYWN